MASGIARKDQQINTPLIVKAMLLFLFLRKYDPVCLGKLFDIVAVRCDMHDWDSRNLSNALLQALVASCHDITSMLLRMRAVRAYLRYALDKAVVCIRAFVRARETGESRISCNLQGYAMLCPKLLQLSNDTVGDARNNLGVEGFHCGIDNVKLVLDRKVDKVCIQQDVVGRAESSIVAEKEISGDLFDMSNLLLGFLSRLPLFLPCLSGLFAGVRRGDDPFDLCKLFYRLLFCLTDNSIICICTYHLQKFNVSDRGGASTCWGT